MCGEASELVPELQAAAGSLYQVFTYDLKVGLACDKLVTFASSLPLAQRLGRALGQLAGTVTTSTVSLGVDLAP